MTFEFKLIPDEDLEVYHDLMNDKSLAVNAGSVPHPISLDWARDRLAARRSCEEEGTLADRGLYEDGALVGAAGYFYRDYGLEIGYCIHRNHRGRGLATIAAELSVKLAREHRKTGPIAANYFQDNPVSGRVLEKIGFVRTGEQVGSSAAREGEIPSYCTELAGDLHLSPVQESDIPALFRFQDDKDAQYQAAGGAAHESEEAYREFLKRVESKGAVFRTILLEGAPVGYIAAFDRFELRELSYWIGRKFWGQGLATRAVGQWIKEYPLPEGGLYARAVKDHPASARVLDKNGFSAVKEESYFSDIRDAVVEEILYKHD